VVAKVRVPGGGACRR